MERRRRDGDGLLDSILELRRLFFFFFLSFLRSFLLFFLLLRFLRRSLSSSLSDADDADDADPSEDTERDRFLLSFTNSIDVLVNIPIIIIILLDTYKQHQVGV